MLSIEAFAVLAPGLLFAHPAQFPMNARAIDRLLEKTYGMADTARSAAAKTTLAALRDARLPDALKARLVALYGEESLRRTLNYAGLGLAICRAIEPEAEDEAAREQLEFYRSHFREIYTGARANLERDFAGSRALEPE